MPHRCPHTKGGATMAENRRNESAVPSSTAERALVRQLREGGTDAGSVFRDLLRRPRDATTEHRLMIRRHPVTAIAALRAPSEELGLTERGAADALDEVIAEVDQLGRPRRETQRLLRQGLSRSRLRELIAARGDLPSVVSAVVDGRTIIEAIIADAGADGMEPAERYFIVRTWAYRLSDRDDWPALLRRRIEVFENRTLADIILACLYYEANQKRSDEDDDDAHEGVTIAPDTFTSIGIEPADGMERIHAMLVADVMPAFSTAEVVRARKRITERRQRHERAPQIRAVRAATESAKDTIDIE